MFPFECSRIRVRSTADTGNLIRGKIPIFPATQYSISDMEKAMRLMQSGKHMGKLVLVPGLEDKVKVSHLFSLHLSGPFLFSLRSDAK